MTGVLVRHKRMKNGPGISMQAGRPLAHARVIGKASKVQILNVFSRDAKGTEGTQA
jgi:hypothetical protein